MTATRWNKKEGPFEQSQINVYAQHPPKGEKNVHSLNDFHKQLRPGTDQVDIFHMVSLHHFKDLMKFCILTFCSILHFQTPGHEEGIGKIFSGIHEAKKIPGSYISNVDVNTKLKGPENKIKGRAGGGQQHAKDPSKTS